MLILLLKSLSVMPLSPKPSPLIWNKKHFAIQWQNSKTLLISNSHNCKFRKFLSAYIEHTQIQANGSQRHLITQSEVTPLLCGPSAPEHKDLHSLPCEVFFIKNTLVEEITFHHFLSHHVSRFFLLGVTELQVVWAFSLCVGNILSP